MNGMVSIIIRTCNRPSLLHQALISVQSQTVYNIEVVVVEDGQRTADKIIEQFADLNLQYYSTGEKVGRTRAANLALSLAHGDYINFLDDDDLLMKHHVQSMLEAFAAYPEADAIHAASLERAIRYHSLDPLKYTCYRERRMYDEPFDADRILHQNMFPIQAVMFKREIYEHYGGMDERLQMLEDWDLWIKYSLYGQFRYLDKVTSIYHVPYDRGSRRDRNKELRDYEKAIQSKYKGRIARSSYVPPRALKIMLGHIRKHGFVATLKNLFERL